LGYESKSSAGCLQLERPMVERLVFDRIMKTPRENASIKMASQPHTMTLSRSTLVCSMFRIKICGITSVADAVAVAECGADAVGLNFCASSPRHVSLARAQHIVAALPSGVARVGVMVNRPAAEVRQIADQLRLDYVQLHGDEPPEYLAQLGDLPIIRALRGTNDFRSVADYLAACRSLGHVPAAVLIDAFREGQYGGTGHRPDWAAVASARAEWPAMPLVLAGGLTPDNIGAAIERVRPTAVDTASGVESAPGQKSLERVAQFVGLAQAAFDKVSSEH
jgi:phosphoribosylanthranilate isomerase